MSTTSRLRRQVGALSQRAARRAVRTRTGRRLVRPEISVIVPFYNVESYLAECLDSIVAQGITNIEVLLVDDGSPDGSRVIAERYTAQDRRFRIITRENGGLGAARNTGVRHARGRFLTFVDSDDKLPAGALARLHDSLTRSGSDMAVGAVERFDRGKSWYPTWIPAVHDVPRIGIGIEDHLPLLRNLYTWNKLFRTDFYKAQDLWFREGVPYEDQPIITQLFARAGSIDMLPDIVYRYREREDKSSISQQTASVKDLRARIEAWRISAETIQREMSDEIYQAWLQTLFEAHFWWYLSSPGTVDDTYWEELQDAVRTYAGDASDWVWQATSPARRVAVKLALLDRRADLQEFVRRGGAKAEEWPAHVRDDGVLLELPFHDDETLDDDLFLLRPAQLELVHAIENLHWVGDGAGGHACWLAGWAYLAHVDLTRHRAEVSVVLRDSRTGTEHVHPATEDVELTTFPPIQFPWCDVMPGAFGVRVPVDQLTEAAGPGAAWEVLLRVEVAGLERTAPVTRLLRMGAAASVPPLQLNGGRTLVADWQLRRPLRLRVRPTGVRLAAVALDGRRVQGTIDPESAGDVVGVSVSADGRRAEVPVVAGRDGLSFSIELPQAATLRPGRARRWSIEAWTADGESRPLAPPDVMTSGEQGETLVLATTPTGQLEVEEWRLGAVADEATVTEQGGLTLQGRVFGQASGSVRLVSRNKRGAASSSTVDFTAGRFQITHDLLHDVHRFGRLPVGEGDHDMSLVIVPDDEAAAVEVPLRVSPVLSDELPIPVRTARHEGRVVRGPDAKVRFTAHRPIGDARGRYQQNQLRRGRSAPGRTRGVLMRSYFGEKATDNGVAIQAELARRGSDLPIYWAVQDHSIPVPDGGTPVVVNSREWYELLDSVDYYVDNMYQPEYHHKREGQVLVETFHGYPFKQMGHPHWRQQQFSQAKIDTYDARAAQWDYLVSPARYATPHLTRDFAYSGEVLEIGYPRNDVLQSAEAPGIRDVVRESLGIRPDQTAVLYAPTFRDYLAEDDNEAFFVEFLDYQAAMQRLGDDHVLLVRGHAFNARSHQRIGRIPGCVDVTDYPEVSDLYLAADACITDYSSLRFDFGVTGKPMIFHVPDLQRYKDARGWIMEYEPTAPGPLTATTEDVVDHLLDMERLRTSYSSAYEKFRQDFLDLEDGSAAARFVDAVFVPRGDA